MHSVGVSGERASAGPCGMTSGDSPRANPNASARSRSYFELHELVTDRRDEKALGLGVGQHARIDIQAGGDADQGVVIVLGEELVEFDADVGDELLHHLLEAV
jgi:hypothetical protein